jgi:regulatory protein
VTELGRRRRRGREEPADSEVDRGPVADPESVARTIVLTRLTAKARSRQELAEALASRDVPTDVADRVLDRFTDVGLVDDAAFARSWVESRQARRGLSRRALADELRRKGIADEIVSDSLADIDDETEYTAARALVEKKLRSTRVADPRARWRQLVGLLARRGYSSGLAMRVVRDVLAAEESGADQGSGDQPSSDWR